MRNVIDFVTNHITHTGIKSQLLKARNGTLDKVMHIVPESKVLYVPIPKAANTSIITILWRSQGIFIQNNIHKSIKKKPAPVLSDFSNAEIENALNNTQWFRFTFVRNPYTRLFSCYKNKILNTERNKNFLKRLNWTSSKTPSFDEFILQLNQPDILKMDWHWRPQYDLIMPALVPLDFIGKIENFNEDILAILDRLNITNEAERQRALIPTNRTQTTPIDFSRESIDLINTIYAKDFSYFGYEKQ